MPTKMNPECAVCGETNPNDFYERNKKRCKECIKRELRDKRAGGASEPLSRRRRKHNTLVSDSDSDSRSRDDDIYEHLREMRETTRLLDLRITAVGQAIARQLNAELAERDKTIASLSTLTTALQSENSQLRSTIEALTKRMAKLEARSELSIFTPVPDFAEISMEDIKEKGNGTLFGVLRDLVPTFILEMERIKGEDEWWDTQALQEWISLRHFEPFYFPMEQ